jgi:hypothetical protein
MTTSFENLDITGLDPVFADDSLGEFAHTAHSPSTSDITSQTASKDANIDV